MRFLYAIFILLLVSAIAFSEAYFFSIWFSAPKSGCVGMVTNSYCDSLASECYRTLRGCEMVRDEIEKREKEKVEAPESPASVMELPTEETFPTKILESVEAGIKQAQELLKKIQEQATILEESQRK